MIKPEKGVLVAQRYELTRPLARGGMGSVWIERHRDLDVDVTIKFMGPSLIASADARMRFEREARVAARLDSQHVVHVQDYGVEDDTPYLVMELLKGESLAQRLARDGTLSLPAATPILHQMCKALRTAHEAGLVHRDLKPGNVFLARKDEEEVVKILDFGIAKAADLGDAQASTESGVLMGSVHYMSPEQIRSSRAVDHRSDLWSIGVILYRTLGGRLPFPGDKMGDVLVRVCTEPFSALSTLLPDLPTGIDGFFLRALERDPDRRFQSATEMSAAFGAMMIEVTSPPVAAAPPSSQPAWLSPRMTAVMPPQMPFPAAPPVAAPAAAASTVAMASPYGAPAPLRAPAGAMLTTPSAGVIPSPQSSAPTVPFVRPTPPLPGAYAPVAAAPFAQPLPPADPDTRTTGIRFGAQPPPLSAPPSSTVESPSHLSSSVTAMPRRPSRFPVVAAVIAPLALIAVAIVALTRSPSGSEAATSPAASPAASLQPPAPVPAPSPSPSPAAPPPAAATQAPALPASSPEASAEPPEASASAAPAEHAGKPTPKPRPAAGPNCNPPYRVDSRGVRVPKMECL